MKLNNMSKLLAMLLLLTPQMAMASTGVSLNSNTNYLLKYCFCGAVASMWTINFVHPLEILKVRLQTDQSD